APGGGAEGSACSRKDTSTPSFLDAMIARTGCLEQHRQLQECMAERQDWRHCQAQLRAFGACMARRQQRER
ncbi:COA4 factor, partial [Origma solitaria]|nr:COA4 factor [Origma solitaria]